MRILLQILLLFLSAISSLFSQQLTDSSANDFVQKLILNTSEIRQMIDPKELTFAERLGIQYDNVPVKFFIGNDFPESVKELIRSGSGVYTTKIEKLSGPYSLLTVSIPAKSITQKYYFKNSSFISAVSYWTGHWKTIEGRYLSIRVSDSTLFNIYSMERLDMFVEQVMEILSFTHSEKALLQQEKILYVRCKDENEVEQVTGFKSLGMAVLSMDAVVTQFNCHYHELAHLLINYKLKKLPLYTHSFFQEGFAVAVGGRGGKEPNVILELGQFIAKSGFESYRSLLDRNGFASVDPSISYALSGLYNSFLLSRIGFEAYRNLYLKFSSANPELIQPVSEELLPPQAEWNTFIESRSKERAIFFTGKGKKRNGIWYRGTEHVDENDDSYFFAIHDTLAILKEGKAKYFITVTPEEIRIVNSLSGNLIANYVPGFSLPPEPITTDGKTFRFYVRKEVFDEKISKKFSFKVD